ncbi:MAG TPA: cation-transporting P-type ATPase [Gaiellaceae bacterium]|nr:cation-transporting P-type ATPase [Gaiellaceae bacterium]
MHRSSAGRRETSDQGARLRDGALHARPFRDVARELGTDVELGLTEDAAEERLARFGPNRLAQPVRPHYVSIALRQFADPLVGLLVGATAVSVLIGEYLEAAAIGAIVILNALLGFVQEARAERAVLALRDVLERRTHVVRDGRERQLGVEDIVPGDLVVLRDGERVPADGRLVAVAGLAVDESALTGESVPTDKLVEPAPRAAPLAERYSMVYAGSAVTRGRGRAVVTATGSLSELGRIAGLTALAKPPSTPLQRRVRGLSQLMVGLGVVVTLTLAGAMLARGSGAEEAFLVGVSVAVAAVPEGLAATVTIALALGARAMAERGAIARRLTAVETLGSATVIASDKTGTLTENRLRLTATRPAPGVAEPRLLAAAALASTAVVIDDGEVLRHAGDPVDAALVLAAHERGLTRAALQRDRHLVRELPFDPIRKCMTLIYEESDGVRAYVKGAPEVVLERSTMAAREVAELEAAAESWASEGLKVLAIAERQVPDAALDDDAIELDLEVVGLVALRDPLRETARHAVREARSAGLRVEMVTGDHPVTARAIGRQLDLDDAAIHARVTPAEKLVLVESLQAQHEVVAVTGDGVNDAPALRRADVGVAMGRSGTEAAREAADLVLTDDDFATIVAAIREGRAIADNIRKFVAFLLSANLGEVALFGAAILAGLGAPMTVVQVLLVNVLTDGLPAIALTRDPPSPQTMRRGPERSDRLFPPRAWAALAMIGGLVGAAALVAFLVGREGQGDAGQTMAFATVAFAELALVFALRSPIHSAWDAPRNRYLVGSVVLSGALVLVMVYLPALNEPLGTVPLGASELLLTILLAVVPFLCVEAGKQVLRRSARALEGLLQ